MLRKSALAILIALGLALGAVLSGNHVARASTPPKSLLAKYLQHDVFSKALKVSKAKIPGLRNQSIEFSYNWSGVAHYSNTVGAFSSVSASWHVPQVFCNGHSDQIEASWVGIDGFNDSTVEQLGTSSLCWEGRAYYQTWWELYPNNSVTVGVSVKPGDVISASTSATRDKGTFHYRLSLVDAATAHNSFTVRQSCPVSVCEDASVEWVIERPAFILQDQFGDELPQYVPLPDFHPSAFTDTQYTLAPKDSSQYARFAICDVTGSYLLDWPNAPQHGEFWSTWLNSY